MFYNGLQLLELCNQQKNTISSVMIMQECCQFAVNETAVRQRMKKQWQVMQKGIQTAMTQKLSSMGGLIGGEGQKLIQYKDTSTTLSGPIMVTAMAYAMGLLEVNASMGIIVAAPTGGSCGILPGTLNALKDARNWSDDQIVQALFNAAAIGTIIVHNATVSGAEGGCQAETGSAAAMTASAVCELMGASPDTCLHAAAICLKNVMGQVCDPVAGLVESPCQKRNGIGVANALISADMALAGVTSLIPFDEVVLAMGEVGRSLPETLRETAKGGIAMTPTACRLARQMTGR